MILPLKTFLAIKYNWLNNSKDENCIKLCDMANTADKIYKYFVISIVSSDKNLPLTAAAQQF